MTSHRELSVIIVTKKSKSKVNVVLSWLDNIRDRFRNLKGPRAFDWVISLKTNRAASGFISLIRVRSNVAHPTASRREIRDRRASLIAPFPSQASPPFPLFLPLSFSLSRAREFSRLSTAVVNYCRGRFRREFHRNTLPDLHSYEDYRVYESAWFAKWKCYRQDFAESLNYVCMESLHFIRVTFFGSSMRAYSCVRVSFSHKFFLFNFWQRPTFSKLDTCFSLKRGKCFTRRIWKPLYYFQRIIWYIKTIMRRKVYENLRLEFFTC